MTEYPEFWLFTAVNLFVFLLGTGLTLLSAAAYRRTGKRTLRYAIAGFAVLTLGGVIDTAYELGIKGVYEFSARELTVLHTVDSLLIGLGLAALFHSLRRY